MIKRGLVALAVLYSGVAQAYPENVRYGYQTCGACHVSPSGGGNLTNYGRGFAEELATYKDENSGGLLYGLVNPPEWLLIGGDTRYLNLHTVQGEKSFAMQRDFEISLKSKELTVDASVGSYYGIPGYQSRRNYVMWSPDDGAVAVRIGHFFPAYGLALPDHTAATRQGLGYGEGQESYNAEASVRGTYGELFLTATAGDDTTVTAHPGQGSINLQNNSYTARASAFIGNRVTLGGSYSMKFDDPKTREQNYGPYAMFGFNEHFYLLTELDRHLDNNAHFDVSYSELGYELYRGIHLQLTHEYESQNVTGIGLQLFPLAHLEILAKVKYEALSGNVYSEILLHLNW